MLVWPFSLCALSVGDMISRDWWASQTLSHFHKPQPATRTHHQAHKQTDICIDRLDYLPIVGGVAQKYRTWTVHRFWRLYIYQTKVQPSTRTKNLKSGTRICVICTQIDLRWMNDLPCRPRKKSAKQTTAAKKKWDKWSSVHSLPRLDGVINKFRSAEVRRIIAASAAVFSL